MIKTFGNLTIASNACSACFISAMTFDQYAAGVTADCMRRATTPRQACEPRLRADQCAGAGWARTITPTAALERTQPERGGAWPLPSQNCNTFDAPDSARMPALEAPRVAAADDADFVLATDREQDSASEVAVAQRQRQLPRIRTSCGAAAEAVTEAPELDCFQHPPVTSSVAAAALAGEIPLQTLPRFVVARGGVAFAISPPAPRLAGRSRQVVPRSPSTALLRLRKLRRNAQFRLLARAPTYPPPGQAQPDTPARFSKKTSKLPLSRPVRLRVQPSKDGLSPRWRRARPAPAQPRPAQPSTSGSAPCSGVRESQRARSGVRAAHAWVDAMTPRRPPAGPSMRKSTALKPAASRPTPQRVRVATDSAANAPAAPWGNPPRTGRPAVAEQLAGKGAANAQRAKVPTQRPRAGTGNALEAAIRGVQSCSLSVEGRATQQQARPLVNMLGRQQPAASTRAKAGRLTHLSGAERSRVS